MATDSQQVTTGLETVGRDRSAQTGQIEQDITFPSPISKDRQEAIDRIVSQRNLPLIEAGIEAYKRDLPRLLSENRYRQWVAYRGAELVAFGSTRRQLRKRLEKRGLTNLGEIFRISVAPLEIDEDEDLDPSPTTLPPSRS